MRIRKSQFMYCAPEKSLIRSAIARCLIPDATNCISLTAHVLSLSSLVEEES